MFPIFPNSYFDQLCSVLVLLLWNQSTFQDTSYAFGTLQKKLCSFHCTPKELYIKEKNRTENSENNSLHVAIPFTKTSISLACSFAIKLLSHHLFFFIEFSLNASAVVFCVTKTAEDFPILTVRCMWFSDNLLALPADNSQL